MKALIRDLRVLLTVALSMLLVACGGGGDDGSITGVADPDPTGNPPTPPVSYSLIEDQETAFRFLTMAAFGGSRADIDALVGRDAADWLADQFAIPYASYVDRVIPLINPGVTAFADAPATESRHQMEMFWDAAIEGDDPLRQRMLFALSQIIVANFNNARNANREAYYLDNLGKHAFGNYRDILQDITYTPLMGSYLTYVGNRKGDPTTGRLPDENYAREILQLFSTGLVDLQMNGEPILVGGEPVETYGNDDIVNLARVFTGLVYDRDRGISGWWSPMLMDEARHSELEKRFLNVVIPANTDGTTSINLALDGIFAHPNVAPFMARQLIQRFTASHPTPQYVERVATAFETGTFAAGNGRTFGTGTRGDLEATLAAILLDPTLFDATTIASDRVGKVREPILRFVHWARAFELSNVDSRQETRLRDTSSASTALAQRPFGSPSVFNFYRPGYVAAGTLTGELGLTAPEFQIVNEGSAIGFGNFMTDYIINDTPFRDRDTFNASYATELALADDADALVDHLALLLTGNQVTDASRASIANAIEAIGIRQSDEAADRLSRVHLAIIMFVNDPSFTVTY
ncbi:MAG: DUF1800 family protein [Pseudomonadota bacterium]